VPYRLSVEQYEAMVASGTFKKEDRLELIEGSLVEKMTRGPNHSTGSEDCGRAIHAVLPAGWHVRIEKPIRVTDRDSEPEPDVSVARVKTADYRRRHPDPTEVGLVVEVGDSSVEDDRAMAMTYGGGSIPVYWLVNLRDGQLEVYTEPSGQPPPVGYRRCVVFHPGQDAAVYLDGREVARIAVADLLPRADEG
jgi:Uma2 family endonuclease